ncbi:OmpA family protein [Lysobacter sp. Root667]|uniref:OmpA family protein n=1 Tax=Lysobacter sp. Root667 TaxID=1736581 RepID=UPI0009E68F15|nr:OmpA family protein [Lysobacter sp. Root667]
MTKIVCGITAWFFAVATTGCAKSELQRESLPPLTSIELNRVHFKAGHPMPGESLDSAVLGPIDKQLSLLKENVALLLNTPGLGAEVIGFSDVNECSGAECRSLSSRRAQLVYRWLLDQSVPASKIKMGEPGGSDWPVDNGVSEQSREKNRRVQLEFLILEGGH